MKLIQLGNKRNANLFMYKDFINWFKIKQIIHDKNNRPDFHEREVWVCSFGCNVGYELDGKEDFLRPVLVYKKLTHNTFLAIPLTSKLKSGSWYYPSSVDGVEGRFIFSQIKIIDSKRLKYRMEQLPKSEFNKIKTTFLNFIQ